MTNLLKIINKYNGIAFISAIICTLAYANEPPTVAFSTAPLIIHAQHKSHQFTVEIAATPKQRERGLMYRKQLAKGRGMLFLYDNPGYIGMWMKHTYIPLDMLFIDASGHITQIIPDTTPLSEKALHATQKVTAVLELNAGAAKQYGISIGDYVEHPHFTTAKDE